MVKVISASHDKGFIIRTVLVLVAAMKFAHHLSAHLTPEWRKHYLEYDRYKDMIYRMAGPNAHIFDDDEVAVDGPKVQVSETELKAFFDGMKEQLKAVDTFYRAREADLSQQIRELEEEVAILSALVANNRTKRLRSSRRKRQTIRLALSEFYLNVTLLQHFQQLNHTGFRKILKKFDKLCRSKDGARFFKAIVNSTYFWASKEIPNLLENTEKLMIEKIERGDRTKAMNNLRVPPLESKDKRSHWVTLRAGWFMGIIFVSLVVIALGLAFRPLDSYSHITPSVRGLRVGFILALWFYGFGINTYGWRRAGVNSVLIFEFDPRHYLNFVQIFEIASVLAVMFLVGVYLTVFSYWLPTAEWLGPLVMMVLILVFFVVPVPIYHRSRIWLAKEMGRIFLAPFFHVTFSDFWIADQMNSLAVLLLDLEYFWCYMIYGIHFPETDCGSVTYAIRPILAALPAWFRFAQCLRRYYTTRQWFPHLVNAGKYSTSFFVVLFSALSSGLRAGVTEPQTIGHYITFTLWIVSAIVSTCYTFTWDIKMDWGLFEGKYKLRSELIYPYKIYYVLAVVEDLVFRALWTLNISVGNAGGVALLHGNILGTVLAILEVARRIFWNFFRLENEHLNNCGDFRVVRDIAIHPLDPTELPPDDEEDGAEPVLRRWQERRISEALVDLSPRKPTLRQRKASYRSHDESHDLSNGSHDTDTRLKNGNLKLSATNRLTEEQLSDDEEDTEKLPSIKETEL